MATTCELSATSGQENCAAWLTAFKDYLQARSLDSKTISNYVQDMQKFQKKVNKDLATVTRDDLQTVLTRWQGEGASDATQRRCVAALRNFYNFLIAGRYIPRSPTANVRAPKGWVRVPRAPAANDLERDVCKAKGLKPMHPHELRHACATHMLDNGAPLVVIQQLLGHAKLSTTALYALVSITLMQKGYSAAHPSAA